jgi:hypothetical protein
MRSRTVIATASESCAGRGLASWNPRIEGKEKVAPHANGHCVSIEDIVYAFANSAKFVKVLLSLFCVSTSECVGVTVVEIVVSFKITVLHVNLKLVDDVIKPSV